VDSGKWCGIQRALRNEEPAEGRDVGEGGIRRGKLLLQEVTTWGNEKVTGCSKRAWCLSVRHNGDKNQWISLGGGGGGGESVNAEKGWAGETQECLGTGEIVKETCTLRPR